MPRKPRKTGTLTKFAEQLPSDQFLLFPVTEIEVDGIGMGVLSDGTPYLTLRGLSRVCGIGPSAMHELVSNWEVEKKKPRGVKIRELLAAQRHDGDSLRLTTISKGKETHAYTDNVCMALLEYYAFEGGRPNAIALGNFRVLARSSMRIFIYNSCGFDPETLIPDSWRNFHARVLLNDQIPGDHFSVFRELADIVIHMIQGGCPIDDHTVPDISAGIRWAKFWGDNGFDEKYGLRVKYPHYYPEWFPQAGSNPQAAWIYPVTALGAFRMWLYSTYLPESFPNYIAGKVKQGVLPQSHASLVLKSLEHKPVRGIESKAR